VEVKVGETTGVNVMVGVTVSLGVNVAVMVGVSLGVNEVAVGETGVEEVAVGVAVSTGVNEVAVGETGVNDVAVGEATGVEGVDVNVAVGPVPVTVRVVPVEGRSVRMLSPFETRAAHSMGLCPATSPVTLKVNAAPLVVALFPLLPAMAKMKLPACVSLTAVTGSAPKSDVATGGSPTSTRAGLKVQVNSALV
jgi:hypothetical protein